MIRVCGVFLLASLAGCATTAARPILRDRDGGVVAIPDNSDRFPDYNRSQAEGLIREHVGRNYEIVKEEEYVLGPVTTSETSTTRRPFLNWLLPWRAAESATTSSTSQTRNRTEYRLQYRKVASPSEVRPAEYRDLPPLSDGVGER